MASPSISLPPITTESVPCLYYPIFLTQRIFANGYLKSVEPAVPLPQEVVPQIRPRGVQGTTTSRLDEVRTYNKTTPYMVGVNGVTEVTATDVTYIIDGITFSTVLATGITTYSFGGDSGLGNANTVTHNLIKDEQENYTEKLPVVNHIFVERNEISVFSQLYKLGRVDTLDDLAFYF